MTTIAQIASNILQARKKRGLKQEDLGNQVSCSGPYITKMEKGSAIPSPSMASKLEKVLRLKKGTLLRKVLSLKERETTFRREAVLKARSGQSLGIDGFQQIPLIVPTSLCQVWGGEEVERYVPIPNEQTVGERLFLIAAPDDSLELSGVHAGDLLLVETRPPKNGDACVFCNGPNTFLRIYRKTREGAELTPHSSNSKHRTFSQPQAKRLGYKGVVRAVYLKRFDGLRSEKRIA